MLKDLSNYGPKTNHLMLNYRPPRCESPIEQKLLHALRYMGLGVETQVPIGDHYVDMIVFGRSSLNEVIIECDDNDFHHNLIDEFRDDELIETARLPVAHISGTEIAESSERCALYIADRWFSKIIDTHGYAATLNMVYGENNVRNHEKTSEFFPVGIVRPIVGESYPSQSDRIHRDYLRYIVGNIQQCNFLNDKEQKRIEEWKTEFAKFDFPKRKFSPHELARFYVLLFYQEPDLSCELDRLDNFLEYRRRLIEVRDANEAEIPE